MWLVRSRDVHALMAQSRVLPPSAIAVGPELRSALVGMVRRRVPESEVEDIVQTTLTEAIASPGAPVDPDEQRRWIFGIAKHKVLDFYRLRVRERVEDPDVVARDAPDETNPNVEELDLLRWAERHLPEGDEAKKTLGWLVREGEGEKLQSIAEQEQLPADRVRQRVSRLRRHFKQHWQREVAVLAALGVLMTILTVYFMRRDPREPITRDVPAPVDPRADQLRKDALGKCATGDWQPCLEGLDAAKELDPAGDTAPPVVRARDDANRALSTPPPTQAPPETTNLPPMKDDAPRKAGPVTTAAPPSSASPARVAPRTQKPLGKKPAPAPNPKTSGLMKSSNNSSDSIGPLDDSGGSGFSSGSTPAPTSIPPQKAAAETQAQLAASQPQAQAAPPAASAPSPGTATKSGGGKGGGKKSLK